jgi:hypothetical protein
MISPEGAAYYDAAKQDFRIQHPRAIVRDQPVQIAVLGRPVLGDQSRDPQPALGSRFSRWPFQRAGFSPVR